MCPTGPQTSLNGNLLQFSSKFELFTHPRNLPPVLAQSLGVVLGERFKLLVTWNIYGVFHEGPNATLGLKHWLRVGRNHDIFALNNVNG